MHPQEAKAVKELAKDDDIIILLADKGRATVVTDRKDYSTKMLRMLGTETPTNSWQRTQPPP